MGVVTGFCTGTCTGFGAGACTGFGAGACTGFGAGFGAGACTGFCTGFGVGTCTGFCTGFGVGVITDAWRFPSDCFTIGRSTGCSTGRFITVWVTVKFPGCVRCSAIWLISSCRFTFGSIGLVITVLRVDISIVFNTSANCFNKALIMVLSIWLISGEKVFNILNKSYSSFLLFINWYKIYLNALGLFLTNKIYSLILWINTG